MIDDQSRKRLISRRMEKSSEQCDNHRGPIIPSHLPSGHKALPLGGVLLPVHDTAWADVAPHGIGWQHTLLFNLHDLHVTTRAQCPHCCLSEMAGVAPSQQGFIQQVLFGPLILSEMWVIGSKSMICSEGCRQSSRGYINCIWKMKGRHLTPWHHQMSFIVLVSKGQTIPF